MSRAARGQRGGPATGTPPRPDSRSAHAAEGNGGTCAFVWHPELARFTYGPAHPFRPRRMALTHGLIRACGLLAIDGVEVVEPQAAALEDLAAFHDAAYLEALRRADGGRPADGDLFFGLGTGDNPVFPGLWHYCTLYAGGSLAAARLVARGEAGAAFSMAGGLHHAHAGLAAGFCYVNDCVLAIIELLKNFDRVLYLDVDVHHGDGVQEAFYASDRVLTASFHQSGRTIFPGTGFETEIGVGAGRGFALNFPFLPGVGDGLWLECLIEVMGAALARFRPGAVVLQLGVDTLRHDPLGQLTLTNHAPAEVVRFIRAAGIPLVMLGGGGYNADQVARAWTLAWGTLLGVQPPDELPREYLGMRDDGGPPLLRDRWEHGEAPSPLMLDDAHHIRDYLLQRVVPLIHHRGGPAGGPR